MRPSGAVALFLTFVATAAQAATPPADAGAVSRLAGHWHCSVAGGPPAERYYYAFPARQNGGSWSAYGRAELTLADGDRAVAFERLAVRGDEVTIDAAEGTGTATASGDDLRFTGSATPDGTLSIAYAVADGTMRRTAARNGAQIDDERCVRLPEAPFPSPCPQPDLPPATLHQEIPPAPAEALFARISGEVDVIITLDDHSRVLWTSVLKSTNHIFDAQAVRAARLSTYRTELRGCRPIAAQYIFTVDFRAR
jgi:hypothetical protein